MELATQASIQRRSKTTPTRLPPGYLLWILFLVFGFAALSLGALIVVKHSESSWNMFPPSILELLGQSKNAVIAQGITCGQAPASGSSDSGTRLEPIESCYIRPAPGAFRRIRLIVADNVVILVNFAVHENALRVGDLPSQWGRPDIDGGREVLNLVWPHLGIGVSARTVDGHFSYFLPIYRISFGLPTEHNESEDGSIAAS